MYHSSGKLCLSIQLPHETHSAGSPLFIHKHSSLYLSPKMSPLRPTAQGTNWSHLCLIPHLPMFPDTKSCISWTGFIFSIITVPIVTLYYFNISYEHFFWHLFIIHRYLTFRGLSTTSWDFSDLLVLPQTMHGSFRSPILTMAELCIHCIHLEWVKISLSCYYNPKSRTLNSQ